MRSGGVEREKIDGLVLASEAHERWRLAHFGAAAFGTLSMEHSNPTFQGFWKAAKLEKVQTSAMSGPN